METISRSLLTFLLNSLWQIPLAATVAALICRLMRHGPARHRHAVWVAALATAILLPLASVRRSEPAAPPRIVVSLPRDASFAQPAQTSHGRPFSGRAPAAASRTVSFAETTADVLLGAYLLFVLFRLARLARASARTLQIRRAAHETAVPELLERVRIRCQEAYGLARVDLLFSAQIAGPLTAGRTIILPESMRAEEQEDVLTAAIGHEMAHIARHDFACNLVYELLYLPMSFHPAAGWIRRGIERTREMACDELVTGQLIDAGIYARSIVSIATGMTVGPRPGYTLGVFDGDILEERIRRLLERPAANLERARLLLVTGLSALALCGVVASSLALTARAQGSAHAQMKQAEAAYNRGDYQEAAAQFESAVKLEPANLKARLLLANTLLREYVPGTDAASPLVARAREQYQEVLARDPANKQATQGMLALLVASRQYAEAHEWAQKAIQADAGDPFGYYTAGVIDWTLSYPDCAAARAAAGMKPQDPGIIPDAALRLKVRTEHMSQIEDGLHMLQVALQLNPDYSDAMAYMNLLYRLQAGIVDSQAQSTDLIAQADSWVTKALAAKRKQAQSAPSAALLDVDGPVPGAPAPPPPPPPPPPGRLAAAIPAGAIRVEGNAQQEKLVSQTPPVYPPLARQARVTGAVLLRVLIGKDGTMRDIQLVSGHPLLVNAAMEAVRKWVYRPTLVNGEPVVVSTTVTVNFQLAGE